MGKLGVMGVSVAAFAVAALSPVREACAQDFGQTWIDRITHLQEQDRGPLPAKPFNWTADAGLQYAFDNNIFLTEEDETSDSIVIPFVQAGFTYSEQRFELEASILANYKFYTKEDADDDEERIFIRARQTSARWNFEITELFQNVSDPSGLQFNDRTSRMVSTTVPKVAFDVAKTWTLEVSGLIQLVRFQENPNSDGQENDNFGFDVGLVYQTPWAFDLVGQIGYYNINYLTEPDRAFGTPDAFGYTYRVGFRGDVVERLSLEALVGIGTIETDFFPTTNNDIKDNTMVVNLNFRYEATDKVNFYFDFARMYTFLGFGDPYQLLNTGTFLAQVELTEGFALRGRLQYDHSESALNVDRDYLSASGGATLKFGSHWVFDGGLTYRWGKSENQGEVKFNDVVFSVGLAFSW